MSVQNAMNAAMYTTMNAASSLTDLLAGTTSIYWLQAPDNDTLPYVVYSLQAGGPENQNPSDMRNLVYWVRGYAETPALAGSIDAQIYTALNGVDISVAGYTNFWTVREEAIQAVENPPNSTRRYASGGMYRVRLDA